MNKLLALSCFVVLAQPRAQTPPSATDWQTDLRFLQRTVHDDYPFLFKKITVAQFDAAVERLHGQIPELRPHQVVAGLGRLVASFGYGHTDLAWASSPVKFQIVPMNLYQFSDGIWVEGAHHDCADALGAQLLSVEHKPVAEVLAAIRPLVPAENDQYFKAHGLQYLLIPQALHAQGVTDDLKKTVTFTLTRDGETFDRTFTAIPAARFPKQYGFVKPGGKWASVRQPGPPPLYLRNLDRIYEFEYLADHKTVYVRHSKIRDEPDEPIPQFYARVFDFIAENDVERLIVDVRLNGGGNNYKNKPIVTGILRCRKVDQPGRLFVIIGRRTFSACQNLVNELDNYTQATFVGEPTAENVNFFGDTRRVELPQTKTRAFLSFAWWQDKPQWENAPWLAPDLAVECSFDDYRANRDPVLNAILRADDDVDPMRRLRSLVAANDFDTLNERVTAVIKDERYSFVDFEPELNRIGYELLRSGRTPAAVDILRLNTELYPSSANVWDSLGEAKLEAGQASEAAACYRKAIALDADGRTATNAREMLRRIENGKRK